MSVSVLHVIPTLDPLAGGTTAALAGMATAQAGAGLKAHVVSTFDTPGADTFAPTLEAQGVAVTMVGPTHGPLRKHADLPAEMRRLAAECDVLHIHGLWEEPQHQAFLTARQLGKPAVLSPHGMLDRWSLAQSKLKKQMYMAWRLKKNLRRVDALHYTTDEEAQSVGRFGLPGKPIVMPLGLDLHEFDPLPVAGRFRADHPAVGDAPYVLFLSRLHHKKGIELLLPAFRALRESHPGHKLVIAGPADTPEYGASLEALAAELGLSEHVYFPGMLRNEKRIEAMVDGQVFVLPSYQENFGIVVPEAAAAGLPQVVSEHVNLASWVASSDVGTVVPLDIGRITTALRDIIDDPQREAIGRRARAATFDTFDWKRIGPRWETAYAELIAAGVKR